MRILTLRRGVRTWLLFALLCTVVGGVAGFGVALVMTPSYASTVEVLIAPPLNSDTALNVNDIQASQALVATYAELATGRTLLDRVIASTRVATTSDKLAGAVSTHAPVGTNLLQITVSSADPSSAAELANSIAAELAKYQFFGIGATTGVSAAVTVTVVDPAIPSTKPQGLGTLLTAALGALVGLMMAICFAFAVENLRRENGREADTVLVSASVNLPAGSPRLGEVNDPAKQLHGRPPAEPTEAHGRDRRGRYVAAPARTEGPAKRATH
jgi:succinoglycan biosynthesis transport protein ExoP